MKRFEATHISPLLSTWEEEVGNNIGRGKKYYFLPNYLILEGSGRAAHTRLKKGAARPVPDFIVQKEEKICSRPGFELGTSQSPAGRSTNCATTAAGRDEACVFSKITYLALITQNRVLRAPSPVPDFIVQKEKRKNFPAQDLNSLPPDL